MKRYGLLIPAFLLITLIISSCGLFVSAAAPSPTPGRGPLATGIDQTLAAQDTTVALLQPTDTPTPTVTETPTETETPTSTETPSDTPLPSATPFTYVPPAASCYSVAFLGDVTIPDGSTLNAGESFTKTWALENTGSCSWNTNFQVIFSSGNSLSASSAVNLPAFVSPGQTVDVSVNMVAPENNGSFEGFWLLRSDTGAVFGLGSGNTPFFVQINVGSGSEAGFAVRHVLMSVDSEDVTVTCPVGHVFTFTGDITTNGSGTVTYYWQFSNGATTDENSLDFSSAGTIDVSTTWALGTNRIVDPNPFDGWARIYIDSPNHQFFGEQTFTLTCSNSSPTNTPRPTRTPTPGPTNTPQPTNTPRPTRSPTSGPTNTPRPTNTSRPSRTPRPSSTPRPTRTPTV